MKKILITGKNSYIGNNVQQWLEKEEKKYEVEQLDMQIDEWKNNDFSKYDCILHVAGIAHVSSEKKMEQLYYKVNRDLAIETAEKAKKDGVKQFVFMSSMIIYGKDDNIGKIKMIDRDTKPNASDFYGKSKLDADIAIQKLSNEKFKTVIIRTPMVYGPNCKGNFQKLKKLVKICPIFPSIENRRSMIYIDNLCEFIKQAIDNEKSGVFFPQNAEYISTKEIIKNLAEQQKKKIHFTRIFNPLIKLLSKKMYFLNKVFGSKIYDKKLSEGFDYIVIDNDESIRRSV